MDKKEVIKAVEEKLGTKAKYKGAPTFSYEITDGKTTYTVTRTGEVLDMNGVERLLECILNSDSTEDEITYTEESLCVRAHQIRREQLRLACQATREQR
jgi:hypothetical protein